MGPLVCHGGRIPLARRHLARVGRLARASALLLMLDTSMSVAGSGSNGGEEVRSGQ